MQVPDRLRSGIEWDLYDVESHPQLVHYVGFESAIDEGYGLLSTLFISLDFARADSRDKVRILRMSHAADGLKEGLGVLRCDSPLHRPEATDAPDYGTSVDAADCRDVILDQQSSNVFALVISGRLTLGSHFG